MVVGILRNMAQLKLNGAATGVREVAVIEGLKEEGLWQNVVGAAQAEALRDAAEVIGGSEEGTAAVGPGAVGPHPRMAGGANVYETDPIGTGGNAMNEALYVKVGDNYVPIPGQVIPTKTDINAPEGWDFVTLHDVKDLTDGWSNYRAEIARDNRKLMARSFDAYDTHVANMNQQHMDERADARQLRQMVNGIFGLSLAFLAERAGVKADVLANQLAFDPQEVTEDALAAQVQAATGTQQEAQSTTAAALASQAYTQNAVESTIGAGLAAMTTDLAQSFRNSIEAMQTTLASQLASQTNLIIETLKAKEK